MKTWREYYEECKAAYGESDVDIKDLTIKINDTESQPIFNFDDRYKSTIKTLHDKVETSLTNPANYSMKNVAMGINDIFQFEDELATIVDDYLVPELESKVFGSYVTCDNIKIYKTPTVNANEASSWLWHLDNNPVEQIKVMIYLNDTYQATGAFRYLADTDQPAVCTLPSRRDYTHWFDGNVAVENMEARGTKWNGTRLSNDLINKWISEGCQIVDVEGPAGTAILFDNNIIHKGTIPTMGHRIAMTIQFKPIDIPSPKFSREYCGNGWNAMTFHKDPEIHKPVAI